MKIHERVIEGNKEKGFEPEKMYADSGYISGAGIRDCRNEGQELMGYIRGENSPKPEDFKVEKFAIDMKKLEAICPAGQKGLSSAVRKSGDIKIYFSTKICKKCQYYESCVEPTNKTKRRTQRGTI